MSEKIDKNLLKAYVMPLHKQLTSIRESKIRLFHRSKFHVLFPRERENYAVLIQELYFDHQSKSAYRLFVIDNGRVTAGQFLKKGKLVNFDLSPDGNHLIFGQTMNGARKYLSVISKIPYFSGLEVFSLDYSHPPDGENKSGGIWVDNDTFMLCSTDAKKIDERKSRFKKAITKEYREIEMENADEKCATMNYRDLQYMMKTLRLSTKGTRNVLIERYKNYLSNRNVHDNVYCRTIRDYVIRQRNSKYVVIKIDDASASQHAIDFGYVITNDGLLKNEQNEVIFNFLDNNEFIQIKPPDDF
jgi:hypothetical protein